MQAVAAILKRALKLTRSVCLRAPHGRARVKIEPRNSCSAGSRDKKCVVRRSIGSKGRKGTGAGSAISLARLRAWFFPENDEVIGEIAAAVAINPERRVR